MLNLAKKQRPIAGTLKAFACGAAAGAVVFLLLYGFSTLNPTYDSWIRCGYIEEDLIQHYAGWQFFRSASWQFPLTWLDNAAAPLGAAAAWADPVPWAALFFKLLSPLLPAVFQYFGLLTLFHFMLQGGFGWLLIGLFDKRASICLPGTLLFCCWPVFLERSYRHMALSAQWLVLWMLYLYFTSRRQKTLPWFSWCILFGLIPGVHAYFLPMAFGMLCACVLENMLRERRFWKPCALVVLCIALALACARGLGVIMPHSTPMVDFGRYSMNLNAPFNPSSMDRYSESGRQAWSVLLPELSQNRLQYDGFNYLGLGILLGLALMGAYGIFRLIRGGFAAGMQRTGRFLWSHIGAVLACTAFTVFAASNHAYFGGTELFHIHLPDSIGALVSNFRASGRMFWPVGYLLALCVIVFCARVLPASARPGRRLGVLALCCVLAVQLADLSGVLLHKAAYFRSGELVCENDYETDKAQQLLSTAEDFRCLGPFVEYRFTEALIRYAPQVHSDILFFARGNFAETEARHRQNQQELLSGVPLAPGVLYACTERDVAEEMLQSADPNAAAWNLEQFYIIGLATPERPAPDLQ